MYYFTVFMVTVSISAVLACVFIMFRNNWVYNQRSKLIAEKFEEYGEYQSYNEMVFKNLFCFDIEKLRLK
jgi:hypothetical protein